MDLEPLGIVPPDSDGQVGRDPVVQQIEELLDADRLEEALAAIEAAIEKGQGNPLDLTFLLGDTYLGLGRAADAEQQFRAVLEHDPDCPASRCWLAMALFLQWRFDEAEVAVAAARELPDAIVDATVIHAMLLERRGLFDDAEPFFLRAAAAAPDKYPPPVRMSRAEFDRELRKAMRQLPKQFRQAFDRVPVVVQDVPEARLAEGADRDEVAPDILGLFDGIPLPETSEFDGVPLRPNTIYLFQRNLERAAKDRADLVEQIRITLYHELGHYLGFEEEDMDDLGLA
ncbi:MAG: metallopeptidase family protein [Planctomycetes bacterium]|jgi:predicted Zn-dependent protease with MMP-like domain|nr:metallopeptidase family protein [Planctomycetota bacterium]